jgi:hypothetical protein
LKGLSKLSVGTDAAKFNLDKEEFIVQFISLLSGRSDSWCKGDWLVVAYIALTLGISLKPGV